MQDGLFEVHHSIQLIFSGSQPLFAAQEVEEQIQNDEDGVNDTNGRTIEVIVITGDELADLVDEDPEADATE